MRSFQSHLRGNVAFRRAELLKSGGKVMPVGRFLGLALQLIMSRGRAFEIRAFFVRAVRELCAVRYPARNVSAESFSRYDELFIECKRIIFFNFVCSFLCVFACTFPSWFHC